MTEKHWSTSKVVLKYQYLAVFLEVWSTTFQRTQLASWHGHYSVKRNYMTQIICYTCNNVSKGILESMYPFALLSLFWRYEPLITKLGMVVHHCSMRPKSKKKGCYLHGQGCYVSALSKVLYNQNIFPQIIMYPRYMTNGGNSPFA